MNLINNIEKSTVQTIILLLIGLGFVLFLHGAVPFFAIPTLGQAIWTTGFSQSFLNESIFSIFANNFGAPEPAAIAFGLAGAWPTALFIKLGLHPADSYAAMVALWLGVAFFSAYRIGRYFNVSPFLSTLAAVFWMSMPVIWAHAGYSMVSIGIGLLPLYFLSAFYLFLPKDDYVSKRIRSALLYFAVCLISIFMDGYSFMMFAAGSSILAFWLFAFESQQRKRLILFAFPVHIISFGFAYYLFALYIGKPQFNPAPLDFFRGWGVDLMFLAIPATGMQWLPDLLGWSLPRTEDRFFGDASVWMTTFSILIIAAACWAGLKVSAGNKPAEGIIIMAIFGFYMALGPSLKMNSNIPAGEPVGPTMAAEYAIAPTGSALLSENLPGFKNMRASYRWLALGIFGSWLLLVMALSTAYRKTLTSTPTIIVVILAVFNLPHLDQKWIEYTGYRKMFLSIDAELLNDMQALFTQGEKVAFLPWHNDFLVNYVASHLNVISYNIGGDKNLAEARVHWPQTMRQFPMGVIDDGFDNRVILLLARHEVDAVILPYIDLLRAAHHWPYPAPFRTALPPIVSQLNNSKFVDVTERAHYAVVRLNAELSHLAHKGLLEPIVLKDLCIAPVCLKQQEFLAKPFSNIGVFTNGKIAADGRRGFLHFGPYRPMNAGRYRLVLYGFGTATESAWADVVSKKGTLRHGQFPLGSIPKDDEGVLVEGLVTLESPVEDLEIRVFVGEQDAITLVGYQLTPTP